MVSLEGQDIGSLVYEYPQTYSFDLTTGGSSNVGLIMQRLREFEQRVILMVWPVVQSRILFVILVLPLLLVQLRRM
ncbi:hypothetical protein A9498_31030 (plasmid) [Bacillus thuringiensis serovar coreanensis]|nr:hypothetical protein A9498_31030 [Bacillus thuringiensis serovar coreanensis]